MDQTNQNPTPQTPMTPNQPVNPEIPQPLTTSANKPTEVPMGEPVVATPPPAGTTPPPTTGTPETMKSGGSSKMMMLVIIILVVAILAVGGYYFYMTQMGDAMPEKTDTPETQTSQDLSGLQTQLESIEVSSPEGELMEINEEIETIDASSSPSATPKS